MIHPPTQTNAETFLEVDSSKHHHSCHLLISSQCCDETQEHCAIMKYFLPLSVITVVSSACELSNLEIRELPMMQSSNSTSLHLSWEHSHCGTRHCAPLVSHCDDETKITVKLSHLQYLGCRNSVRRDFKKIVREVENSGLIIIQDIHIFSKYSVQLCIENVCNITQEYSTKERLPRVTVEPSPYNFDHKDTETQLTFNWRPPKQSQCPHFFSRTQFYHYKLFDEAGEQVCSGTLSEQSTEHSLRDLTPATCYSFFIFVTNSTGGYDETIYKKIEKCTKSTTASTSSYDDEDLQSTERSKLSGTSLLALVSAILILVLILVLTTARVAHKYRNKRTLQKEMSKYFQDSEMSENSYDTPSSRTRSPTDPLPPINKINEGDDVTEDSDDVPGYLKLKNYVIFNPAKLEQNYDI